MKSILLTSTALVMVAGIAAADGHSSMTWTGTAKAGLARAGSAAATAAKATDSIASAVTTYTTATAGLTTGTTIIASEILALQAAAAVTYRTAQDVYAALTPTLQATNANQITLATAKAVHDGLQVTYAHFAGTVATTKADAGDFKAYSEVNATVTGTVTAGGMTLAAGVSVDAGTGYDFDDDNDDFDSAKTNGVGLDAVSLDMGSAGKITLNDDAIAHLVDGDDDGAADISYANTFGGATFTAAMDLDKNDLDAVSKLAGKASIATATTVATASTATSAYVPAVAIGDVVAGTAAVSPDVQWSAKVAMPIGAGSVYVAMDEESGNAFGGSAVVSGMTLSIDSKLEALGADLKLNRANTIGVATTMGAVSGSFAYDSIKDGNQWSVSAGYTAGDMAVSFATNEASSWKVQGTYALGTGASIEGGVNYSEDAFLGLSFAF